MNDNLTFLSIIVGTAWDIYFLFYRNTNRPLSPTVKEGLKDDLLSIFGRHDCSLPDISCLVDALAEIPQTPSHYWDCNEKNDFVMKFSEQLAESFK